MKRTLLLSSCALLLCACSAFHPGRSDPAAAARAAPPPQPEGAAVEIEKVAFRTGISSVTVENMAKRQLCSGGLGAALVTEPGPVEVYRMMCASGKVFMARCELRQCRPM